MSGVNGLTINAEPEGTLNSYWMVTVIPDPSMGLSKFTLMEELLKRNIDTRPFFSRLSTLPAFVEYPQSGKYLPKIPVGQTMADYGVNLPSGYHVTAENVKVICDALKEILSSL